MNNRIDKSNVADIFELSTVQKGMLFHYLKDENGHVYNVQLSFAIEGVLNVHLLQQALQLVQQRNEVLRAIFRWDKTSKPLQIVLHNLPLNICFHDISGRSERDRQLFLDSFTAADRLERFHLSEAPLRINLVKTATTSYTLYISHHHILYDGWSTGILLQQLFGNYRQLLNGHEPEWQATPSYKEVLRFTKELAGADVNDYWLNYLEGYTPQAILPRKATVGNISSGTAKKCITLPLEPVQSFAAACNVTPAAVVYAALGLLLQKRRQQQDVVFGTAVSNRNEAVAGIDRVIGNFINTIPLRLQQAENVTVKNLVTTLHHQLLQRNEYNSSSYYDIKKALNLPPAEELFDVVLVVENYPLDENAINCNPNFSIRLLDVYENTGIPLVITVFFKEQLEIEAIYQAGLIEEETVALFIRQFGRVLASVTANGNQPAAAIDLLTDAEKTALIYAFNETATPVREGDTIVSLFDKQAAIHPEAIALEYEAIQSNYAALQHRAAQVSAFLRSRYHIGRGDLVGVMLDRDADIVPVILGILKAGAAYVPVDPAYPAQRIQNIITASDMKLVVSRAGYAGKLSNSEGFMDLDDNETAINSSTPDYKNYCKPDDLAYVIFTSGSTGLPKGVMIEHRSLVNYITWAAGYYTPGKRSVFPLYSSVSFDLTVTSIFAPLVTGGSIVVYNDNHVLAPIERVINDNLCDVIKLTPSHLKIIRDLSLPDAGKRALVFIVGGEELEARLAKDIHDKFNGNVTIYNEYGPTEATVGCMIYRFNPAAEVLSVPIGTPIANTQIYILDQLLQPVAFGVTGELYIAGSGLARGYLGNEQLTNEKFINNPFLFDAVMYKSGDHARRMADGTIIYEGRIDEQVKIRGFRIETGEVEHHLAAFPGIKEAVVKAQKSGNHAFLAAYYTGDKELPAAAIKNTLEGNLPEYMVPAYYKWLPAWPLTANGKLDKKALPEITVGAQEQYEAPRTLEERLLVQVWQEVLGSVVIGITDNFFAAGGDSIKCIQVSAKMRSSGYQLSVKDIFNYPTIKALAAQLKPVTAIPDQQVVIGEATTSAVQRWFFDKLSYNRHHFNQSVLLHFANGIQAAPVQRIFAKILEHHDALRMVFTGDKGIHLPVQPVVNLDEFIIYDDNTAEERMDEISSHLQAGFDLKNGPLYKLALFHTRSASYLLIAVHHLVIDGVSWRILLEDVDLLLQQSAAGKNLLLPLKTHSFSAWNARVWEYANTRRHVAALQYWNELSGKKVIPLPRDKQGEFHHFGDQEIVSFQLTTQHTSQLLTQAQVPFNTQVNDFLLTAFVLAAARIMKRDALWIDMEGHGREDLINNFTVSRTIGWFTSIFPVLLEKAQGDAIDTLCAVKEMLRRVPNKGFDYLIGRYHADKPAVKPVAAQVSFNYLGQFTGTMPGAAFTVSELQHGTEVSSQICQEYDWNIIAQVRNGKLQVQLAFSIEQYEAETIKLLMGAYKEELTKLLQHCSALQTVTLTTSDLLYTGMNAGQLQRLQQDYAIENIYPLSPMQEGILFHYLVNPTSPQYVEQKTLRLEGALNLEAMETGIQALMARFDVLRTAFLHEGLQTPLQLVLKERKAEFQYKDLRATAGQGAGDVSYWQEQDRNRGFNLSRDVLMRVMVLQTADNVFEVIWTHHHIIMDGWCMGILWNAFKQAYASQISGKSLAPATAPGYAAYLQWLAQQNREEALQYWKNYLQGYDTTAAFPVKAGATPGKEVYEAGSRQFQVSVAVTARLQQVCREQGVTVNTFLQTAWGLVLAKYNNTNDVVFGSVVAGRPPALPAVEDMVGLFINTIPVRIQFSAEASVASLLQAVQQNALEADIHQYHPLMDVQSVSELGRHLLNHIMVFENYPLETEVKNAGSLPVTSAGFALTKAEVFSQTSYDLTVIVVPGDVLQIELQYNANVYNAGVIENLLQQLAQMIENMCTETAARVAALPVITSNEKQQLLQLSDRCDVEYPAEKNLVHLFREQAARTPGHIAVKYEETVINYRDLDRQSDQLATMLLKEGVQPNEVVGLLMDRGIDTITGMLAILKAGGAYLPVDVDYPDERIAYLISDSGLRVLVTSKQYQKNTTGAKVLYTEDLHGVEDATPALVNRNVPADLCYVIYTSGTTGNPKGVMVEHKNVVRLFFNEAFQFQFTDTDVWTMFHSHCFDFSVWEIYGALLFGGKVVVIPKLIARNPEAYLQLLRREKVTILNQTPSAFYNIADEEVRSTAADLALRYVIFGGEALSPARLQQWNQKYPYVTLVNMFGITETTVHVTYKAIGEYEIANDISNVGKPIPTLCVYVLDSNMQFLPAGTVGELYVGGEGVSRGYLGKQSLTESRFISNPYRSGERLYKTGDLGRILENGDLEYMGRIDDQVQLRGYRIELGEIASQLEAYEGISKPVVLAKEIKGEKYLVAYYVTTKNIDTTALVAFLSDKLPDYMIPSYYIPLTTMPLTYNGKLDKKALPEPQLKVVEAAARAKNQVQKDLVHIWSDILQANTENIGIHTNFFEIGGNSLKLVKMTEQVNRHFGANISVANVFTYPVIALLAEFLNKQPETVVEEEEGTDNMFTMNETISLLDQLQY